MYFVYAGGSSVACPLADSGSIIPTRQITVNDPKYYSRPFTVTLPFHLIPDSDVLEAVCSENEKDRAHLH